MMRRCFLGPLAASAVVGCAAGGARTPSSGALPAHAPERGPTAAEQPVPEDLRDKVQFAEQIGPEIYLRDKASAIGTDVLLERVKSLKDLSLGGFLTVHESDESGRPKLSYQVMFFTRGDDLRIAFRIHVSIEPGVKPTVEEFKPPAPVNDGERLLIRARQTAITALREVVQPINPVVIPGGAIGEEGISVYLLAGTKRPNVAVLGRHYRVLVSTNGRTVERFEPLSKGVIEMPTEPPPGSEAVGLFVSNLVTDYPLETHVFASMLYRLPIFVTTARGDWRVDGSHIAFLGPRSK